MQRPRPMTPEEARSLLAVSADADDAGVRRAFRALMAQQHPDVSPHERASEEARALIEARRVLSGSEPNDDCGGDVDPPDGPAPTGRGSGFPGTSGGLVDRPGAVPTAWAAGASVMVAAPGDETVLWLVDAAHQLGDVTFLDTEAALVEATVEFVNGPTVTLTLSTQGRAAALDGEAGTEVFVSMEPWSTPPRPELPEAAAVAELVAHHVRCAAAELRP